ncbi:MAG TPA: serine hydrolase [Oculatellaceae cyanobacterium]
MLPPKARPKNPPGYQSDNLKVRASKSSVGKPVSSSSSSAPASRRLMRYATLASLAVLLQGASLPVGTPVRSSISVAAAPAPPPIPLTYSMDKLREGLAAASDVPKLRTGVFVLDPSTGRYLDLDGRKPYSAASMIKLPVLISLLAAIDRGEVKYTDQLTIRQDLITGGSGSLQWRPVDSKCSVRETAELMMVVSDNTATNMIIDLLGGKKKLSDEFASWGLSETRINNMLGDFEGTNKTSPYDLVYLLARVQKGDLLSADSRKWLIDVMHHTRIRTLLNPGLGPGATIAHKTGDIGTMVGDVGIVYAPNGKSYIVSIQVERPFNDRRGNALIRVLSRGIYKCFSTDEMACTSSSVGSLQDEYRSVPASQSVVKHHRRRH